MSSYTDEAIKRFQQGVVTDLDTAVAQAVGTRLSELKKTGVISREKGKKLKESQWLLLSFFPFHFSLVLKGSQSANYAQNRVIYPA